jgi:hypothetical protein
VSFTIRALATEAEVDAFGALAARTFRREVDLVANAARRTACHRAASWHRPEQLHGTLAVTKRTLFPYGETWIPGSDEFESGR